MKKTLIFTLWLACILNSFTGCSYNRSESSLEENAMADNGDELMEGEKAEKEQGNDLEIKKTIEGDFKTYYEMSDGTWSYDGQSYKYRLVISGRMPNAAKDSTFIYLSNIEDISFSQAYMASGISSNMEDYFEPEEAVFVGWEIPE